MIKILIYGLFLLISLSGCNKNSVSNKFSIAQEKETENLQVESSMSESDKFYYIIAEEKAINIQKKMLENEYQSKYIKQKDYLKQKNELEDLKNSLDLVKKQAEQSFLYMPFEGGKASQDFLSLLQTNDKKELAIIYHNIEVQKDLLEEEEKNLEEKFFLSEITKQEFIFNQISLEYQREEWKNEELATQNKMEQLGIQN